MKKKMMALGLTGILGIAGLVGLSSNKSFADSNNNPAEQSQEVEGVQNNTEDYLANDTEQGFAPIDTKDAIKSTDNMDSIDYLTKDEGTNFAPIDESSSEQDTGLGMDLGL